MDSLHNNHSDVQGTIQSVTKTTGSPQWFVMRDLKRGNAKQPAYKLLSELNIRYFTPMVWKLRICQGKYGVETEDLSGKMCPSGGSFYARFAFRL